RGELHQSWVWWIAGILTGTFCLKALIIFLATWISHRNAYTVLAQLRLRMLDHLRRLPLGFFQTRRVGDLTNVMKNDVEQVEIYLAHGLPETIAVTVIPIIVAIGVFVVDWPIALAMLLGLPLMWLIRKASAKKWADGFAVVANYTTSMQDALTEYVATIPVIKAFAKTETKTNQAIQASKDYVDWVTRSMKGITVPMGLITMSMESGFVAGVIVGLYRLQSGAIDMPHMIIAMILAATFTSTVAKAGTLHHFAFIFNQATKSIGSILGADVTDRPSGTPTPSAGNIVFDNVSFTYPGKQTPACTGISLSVPERSTTALVGSSGCGKTTLMSLLMGFWLPDSGHITVDGTDMQSVSEDVWQHLFSFVSQDVFLFNLTIEENIRIGNPQASRDDIVHAARKARIHDFIMNLSEGYQTVAGEVGARFSGGEKQRLSIARALLKDAPIIVLDEATSALDGENEQLVNAAIEDLSQNKTVFTIAHRLYAVRDADQIVVMDAGRIVDVGSHDQLLQRCHHYQDLVHEQNRVDSWDMKVGKR
ncbi:MAG: ABC transporter ATP-binding protein, partial [Actinomycetaceae bacterium]|nr:ABC transporter ATP-binding protein [Actinomycetaceae bacterium]